MSILLAIFLGLVQGLTEFLPVSSSGHLILFQHLFGLPDNMLLFDILLHIATLCAVLIVFRKKVWQLIRHPFNTTNYCLLISTIITCGIVIVFNGYIERTFTYKILPVTFLLTAMLLCIATWYRPRSSGMGFKAGIIAGIAQGIAVIPGLSRSGITISALLLSGTQRETAAEFSFLMSVPIIIASLVYELTGNTGTVQLDILPTAAAFITALVSGIFAIKFMLQIIKRVKLHWFSLYLTLLALVCLCIL